VPSLGAVASPSPEDAIHVTITSSSRPYVVGTRPRVFVSIGRRREQAKRKEKENVIKLRRKRNQFLNTGTHLQMTRFSKTIQETSIVSYT
jgi:hypothetical protein